MLLSNSQAKTPTIDDFFQCLEKILLDAWSETGFGHLEIDSERFRDDKIRVVIRGSTSYRYVISDEEVGIKTEDAPLVHKGATVTFRPQGTGLLSYTGTVQEPNIDPVVSSDGVQQPHRVTVRVLLNQQDNLLRPGLKGYAHIEAESLLLYQKLQREFVKLVSIGKFF